MSYLRDYRGDVRELVKKYYNEPDAVSRQGNYELCGWSSSVFHSLLKPLLAGLDGIRLLEIGCGGGAWLNAIKKEFVPHCAGKMEALHGIDLSAGLLEKAKAKLGSAAPFHLYEGDFLQFNFETKYNFVFIADAIQGFKDEEVQAVFLKVKDILEGGGIFVIIDKERWSWYNLKRNFVMEGSVRPNYYKVDNFPSFRRLKKLAVKTGFSLRRFSKLGIARYMELAVGV